MAHEMCALKYVQLILLKVVLSVICLLDLVEILDIQFQTIGHLISLMNIHLQVEMHHLD